MKRKFVFCLLCVSLLLSGCDVLTGKSYVSVTPHSVGTLPELPENILVKTKWELRLSLMNMVEDGIENGIIYAQDYRLSDLILDMQSVAAYVKSGTAMGSYAVEDIVFEVGMSGGLPAVDVNVKYRHNWSELRRIKYVDNMEEACDKLYATLESCNSNVVLRIANYDEMDFTLETEKFALEYPQKVMELPTVITNIYPQYGGQDRIVELKFEYQTSREALREMQRQVQPVFDSAALYVSGDALDREKLEQLYSFLMERFDYTIATSITPAYSLLRHAVGDSKAFASVYSAMCHQVGIESYVVSGTHNGHPRCWNIVRDNKRFYHIDLLQCREKGKFQECTDAEMTDYVWDYSNYPQCSNDERIENTRFFPDPQEVPSRDVINGKLNFGSAART